jgi:hypothetical protein
MKKVLLLRCFLPLIFVLSCNKHHFKAPPVASLTVTNAVVGGKSIRIGGNLTTIANNSFAQLSLLVKESDFDIYVWPVGDSAHPYYVHSKFNVQDQEIYSLFIGGTTGSIEGVLIKENLIYHTDSTCGIRFINLSPNSASINVTLSTSPTVNEISNFSYKQFTDYKLYPAKSTNNSYIFQIRKGSDNSLLSSFTLPTPRFANITLVIRGLIGNSNFGITKINNDR